MRRKLLLFFILLFSFIPILSGLSLIKNAYAATCTVSVTQGSTKEFVDLAIDTGGGLTADRYNVIVEGSIGSGGDQYVRSKGGRDKFEFYRTQPSNLNGEQVRLINNGVISVPSLNFFNKMSDEGAGEWVENDYTVIVKENSLLGNGREVCQGTFQLVVNDPECTDGSECSSGICNPDGTCKPGIAPIACTEELGYNPLPGAPNGGIIHTGKFTCKTAIGDINTSPESFAQSVLRIILGISGGILLLLIIINGYKLMVSQGDPEKIKDAREGIIAAITGVLLIIFSLALLQLITVDVLGIPGFG